MAAHRFGVIVLTRNRPDLLYDCLHHLQSSINGGPKPPIFVFDNDDPPGKTEAICAEFGARRLGGTGENVPFSKANNEAARHFKGDILLLNNDVAVMPGCLEAMVAARREGCEVVGAKLLYPHGAIQHYGVGFSREYWPFHIARHDPPDCEWASAPRVVPAVTGALCLISRELWTLLGGLDENYEFGYEDIDFCLEARELGARVGVVPGAVAVHYESQTEGRSSYDGSNFAVFKAKWYDTGRIHAALGVWPFYVNEPLMQVGGPDIGMMAMVGPGD